MIRRWLRALTRTGDPGRPHLSPPPSGRRLRTLLRLEAVEDRTLASVSPLDLPTPPIEAQATVTGPDAPADSSAPVVGDDNGQLPSDGFNLGWDAPASMIPEGVRSAVDGSVLAVAGDNTFNFTGDQFPVARQTAGLDEAESSAKKADSAAGPTTRPAESGSPSVADAGPNRSAEAHPTATTPPTSAADGRGPATAAAVAQTTGSPARADRGSSTGGPGRQPQLNADPSIRRAIGVARTAGHTARAHNQPVAPELSDGALLQRFVANRDQSAFTALVQRHGRLVLNVCQRVLGDFHAAQDASQATFLVLARKAGILDRTNPIGGWLYKVAYHLALRSRAVSARHRLGEQEATDERADLATTANAADVDQRELHQVIREELAALPEKYRAPLTLCYLDGRSHAEAAREIGVPRGSMAKRVGEGLERLRERLLHRGLVL